MSDWSHFLLLALSLPPFMPLQIKSLTILCGISISFNSLSLFFFSLNNKIRKHSAFSIGVQYPSVYQATATVPVRTVLLGVELFDSDFLAEEEDDFFQLLSLASSISICSCLHSLLQNGVFPLQKNSSKFRILVIRLSQSKWINNFFRLEWKSWIPSIYYMILCKLRYISIAANVTILILKKISMISYESQIHIWVSSISYESLSLKIGLNRDDRIVCKF